MSRSPEVRPPRSRPPASTVVGLRGVEVVRDGRRILGPLDWKVGPGERWAIVGPNGSGKTTLLRVLSTFLWPSAGSVRILDAEIGAVDARELRRRIGYVSPALAADLDPETSALDVVVTARHAALQPWWNVFTDDDRAGAHDLLERMGVARIAARPFGTLSSGERGRVLIARALMNAPELLLLDEPAAALDIGAREELLDRLTGLAADGSLAALVLVTHHVEEIPPGTTHGLVLADGRTVAAGAVTEAIAEGPLTEAFGRPLAVETSGGRFQVRSAVRRTG